MPPGGDDSLAANDVTTLKYSTHLSKDKMAAI